MLRRLFTIRPPDGAKQEIAPDTKSGVGATTTDFAFQRDDNWINPIVLRVTKAQAETM